MQPPDSHEPPTTRPPVGHPDYEFPLEVHNLLVTAQSGHVALSAMADSKASILMGAAFVVFSLSVGQITSGKPTVSLILLASFTLLATVFSVLAIRPKIIKPPSIISKNTNIVFFGSFTGLKEEEYIDHVVNIMRSQEEVFRSMARDLYQNGKVLQEKKYKYLSYAYTIFLVGLGMTAVSFVIELAIIRN